MIGFTPAFLSFLGSPIPLRWRMSGDESVPPDTTICLRARNVRDCCCFGELALIMFKMGMDLAYTWMKRLCRHSFDGDSLAILQNHMINLSITLQVKV
jgi:hypothetical protein